MRFPCAIAALPVLLLCGFAYTDAHGQSTEPAAAAATEAIILEVLDAFDQIQLGEYREADVGLSELTESRAFEGLSDTLKREVYLLLSRAITGRRGARGTVDVVRKITELTAAQPADWISRMDVSYRWERDTGDRVYSLTQFLRKWPEQINGLNIDFVYTTVFDALFEIENDQASRALVDALVGADWNLPTSYAAVDRLWFLTALQLLDEGDTERGAAVTRKIRYLPAVIAMVSDRRFDAIRAAASDWFDVNTVIEREIDLRRQNVGASPNQLSVTNALLIALRRANRVSESIEVIGAAAQHRADPDADPGTVTGWTDETQSLRWFLNHRADILWQLGQRQDALAQLQEARTTFATNDSGHVDQTINLARYYARLGQTSRALDAVDDIDGLSEFGEMYVRYVRLMAAVHDQDSDQIWQQIEAMGRNQADSVYLYQRALILAGRLDDAAELMIERLADGETRVGALVELQTYLDDHVTDTTLPLDIRYAEQKKMLLERVDVREAVDAVGRIDTWPVWFTDFEVRYPARR
jgi:tetratricopeptide (TPR) repeat protein